MADYTVQAGDTLTKIAKAHGTSVSELAKQNGITDVNKIEIGQELSLGKTTASAPQPQQEPRIGLDSFEKQPVKQEANTVSPLAYAVGGAAVYSIGSNILPKVTDKAKSTYTNVKTGTKKAYANMKATAKHNAKAVGNFVSQKAKHTAKSVELHYAFGKDAVQKGVKNTTNKVKTKVQTAAMKTKTVAGRAVQKAKVGGRYTRFIANTKIAPKLIKGASRYAVPLAIAFEAGKCYKAFDNGTVEGGKQIAKSTCSLAGGWAGAKIGASLGSFAGPVGTVIGGVAGGILGYCLGEKLCS